MPGKRDYVAEIQDRRLRVGTPNHVILMFDRMTTLLRELENSKHVSDELMRYFPVAMVAFVETYARSMIQELVDAGGPYAERIDMLENVKLEMATMKAIHGRRITLGELIAHILPMNNLEDIKRAVGTLLGCDLIDVVKAARRRWRIRAEGENDASIIDEFGPIIRGVEWTFRLRHMYAHEFPANASINRELIVDSVRATAEFITAMDDGIRDLRYPGAPLSQAEMNTYTAEQMMEVDRELREVITDLSANLDEADAAILAEAQAAWEVVRDRTARLMADMEAEGGSMWPMVYNRFAERITRHRLDEVFALIELSW